MQMEEVVELVDFLNFAISATECPIEIQFLILLQTQTKVYNIIFLGVNIV